MECKVRPRAAHVGVLLFERITIAQRAPGFYLAPNGVTVLCVGGVPLNSTGVVGGVTYTKRDRAGLLALVASESWDELATSCTSDVSDFAELMKDAVGFNADISSWDVGAATSMESMFRGASSFNQDIGWWATGSVTSMKYMFRDTPFNRDIGAWDTSSVEDMSWMFYNADAFDQDIGGWDTSRVRDFSGMFYEATSFDQPIGGWDTSSATTLYAMFGAAKAFNQPIGDWNLTSVTNLADTFWGAAAFDQDLGNWDTSAVTTMVDMFRDAFAFNRSIGGWDVRRVTKTNSMFRDAYAFDQPIGDWDVSQNTRMDDMFNGATAFNQDLGGWETSKVYNMAAMFANAAAFNRDISSWNTRAVQDMSRMFSGASSFNQSLMGWNTGAVTTMAYMFDSATEFDGEIGGWDTSSVTDMSFMFQNAETFNTNIGSWDTTGLTKLNAMFQGALSFNQNIGGWNTSRVTDMSIMFQDAQAFNQDIGGWDTSRVTDTSVMFFGAEAFDQDIGAWDTSAVVDMSRMFSGAASFDQDIGLWNTSSARNMESMFAGALAFNQNLAAWDVKGVSACSNFAGGADAWGNPAGSPPLPDFTSCDPTPTFLETPVGQTTGEPTPAGPSPGSTSSSSTGVIVGVVCGVIFGILLVVLSVWWMLKRRRASVSAPGFEADIGPDEVVPETVGHLPWHVSIHHRLRQDTMQPLSPFGAVGNTNAWIHGNTAKTEVETPADTKRGAPFPPATHSDRIDLSAADVSPVGYGGVTPLHTETHGRLLLAKSPSMTHLSLDQSPLSAAMLERAALAERTGSSSLSRVRSWDGWVQPWPDIDSLNAAEDIRKQRSEHFGRPPAMSILDLPPIGEEFVPGVDMHIPVEKIERTLTKCIGTGGYGKVYKGEYGGVEVAVKRLPPVIDKDKGNHSAYDSMIKEIKLMSKFDCHRIVRVLGACTDDRDNCCLIMELMRGGDLAKKIHDPRRRRLTYIQVLQITQDIAEGLAYLHPLVAHRDLKPANVLLDEHGRAKISDFGISKVKELDKTYLSDTIAFNGTIMYMAPEQLNGGKLDEKVDVYALGVIINEMYTRRYPWPADEPRMMFQILRMVGIEGKRPWVDPDTPERLKRLITKCWSQSPKDRPSCAEIVKTTEILIREELKRLEDRESSSGCDVSTVRSSLGRWSSVELSSVGTGTGHNLFRNLD